MQLASYGEPSGWARARVGTLPLGLVPILGLVMGGLFLVACGAVNNGPSSSARYSVATHDGGQATLFARAGGNLDGQANADGTACFWIGDDSRRQLTLVWPEGYFAAGQPLSLFDKSGAKVAALGQQVTLGGGMAPSGTTLPVGCTTAKDIWLVGEVIEAK